jgi:hypothetical protein
MFSRGKSATAGGWPTAQKIRVNSGFIWIILNNTKINCLGIASLMTLFAGEGLMYPRPVIICAAILAVALSLSVMPTLGRAAHCRA